jgi:plastocyanin
MMRVTRRAVIGGAAACAALPSLAAETTVHQVSIKRFKFDPKTVTVRVGDVIEWTNHDLAPHTATAKEYGWDTGELPKGTSAQIIVTADMETEYFCAFHPHMKGKIEIT